MKQTELWVCSVLVLAFNNFSVILHQHEVYRELFADLKEIMLPAEVWCPSHIILTLGSPTVPTSTLYWAPKFSDRQVWANSAVWSGSTLFAIPFCSTSKVITANCWMSEVLGFLRSYDFFYVLVTNVSQSRTRLISVIKGTKYGILKAFLNTVVYLIW